MPVQILLVDVSHAFDTPQRQALALAGVLARDSRLAPCLCCPENSPLALAARERGLAVLALPDKNPTGLRALWRMWRHQRRDTPLLLHSFDDGALRLCARLARLRGKPAAVRVHSAFGPPPALGGRRRALWLGLDRILCASTHARDALMKAGFAAAALAQVHPGLDLDAVPESAPRMRTAGRFVFVALAPLESASGLDVLIRAMAALWQRDDLGPWEVRIAGAGSRFTDLLEEAKTLGVDSRLSLLGAQTPQDVLPWADAVLAPSVDAYGTPQALTWAWAVRLPLVCSDVPVHAEMARDKRNALLVAPGDPQVLAAAMICLMRIESARTHLEHAGGAMRGYVSQERVARQIRAVYARCLPQLPHAIPKPTTDHI